MTAKIREQTVAVGLVNEGVVQAVVRVVDTLDGNGGFSRRLEYSSAYPWGYRDNVDLIGRVTADRLGVPYVGLHARDYAKLH